MSNIKIFVVTDSKAIFELREKYTLMTAIYTSKFCSSTPFDQLSGGIFISVSPATVLCVAAAIVLQIVKTY